MLHSRSACLALCLLATSGRAQQVWVIAPAPGPGIDFTSLQAAANAAADGDILLVRGDVSDGFSATVDLGAKGLAIVADTPAPPTLTSGGRIRVNGLAAGRTTSIRGFLLPGIGFWPFGTDQGTLSITNSPGTLLVEDCAVLGSFSAVRAQQSGWLGLSNCGLIGMSQSLGTQASIGHGLAASATTTTLHGCTSRGGTGAFLSVFGNPVGLQAGAGAWVHGGKLVAARSALYGGNGAGSTYSTYFSACVYSSAGFGLHLASSAPAAHLLSTTAEPGASGALDPVCTTPWPVPGTWIESGSADAPAGSAPLLDASALTREGQVLSVTLEAASGEYAALLASTSVQPLHVSEFYTPLLNAGASVLPLGFVGAGASIATSATIQELGAGVEGAVLYLQGASLDLTTLSVRLSNVSVAVLLDAGL
ncbi:MAG: hypothetical protein FJ299_02185 [Planctomycetes bacterium]|nr:hypothetical protein [Planctomycetota bacterium]